MTAISPDAHRIWRAVRGPAAIMLLIIGASTVITLVRGSGDDGALGPGSVTPEGSRALARLLAGQGVQVELVHTAAAAQRASAGATVLVTLSLIHI